MTLDCHPAAAAERRPRERAINTIAPIRITAPSRIHSQRRELPEVVTGAGELLGCAAGADVAALGAGVG
jgi:hypothetical protein